MGLNELFCLLKVITFEPKTAAEKSMN